MRSTGRALLVSGPGLPVLAEVQMAAGFSALCAQQGMPRLSPSYAPAMCRFNDTLLQAFFAQVGPRFVHISERGGSMQVAADTVLFTPVYVAAFFAFMNNMEGGNLKVKTSLDYGTGVENS